MRNRRYLKWLICLLLLTMAVPIASMYENVAAADALGEARVLASSPEQILITWSTPAYQIAQAARNGQRYDLVEADGMELTAVPGQPQLPSFSMLVGVPPGAIASVRIVNAESELLPGKFEIPPAPTTVVDWHQSAEERLSLPAPWPADTHLELFPEPAIYDADAFYPTEIAEASEVAYLRQQAFVSLQLYPFQWNPVSGQLRVYKRVEVALDLVLPAERDVSSWEPVPDAPQIEAILRDNLLNYEAAKAWRVPRDVSLSSVWPVGSLDPGFRITVHETGIHQLDQSTLKDAGFPVDTVDPRTLRMVYEDQELAIAVEGEGDGQFDDGDYILFYGEAIETKWTRANVYWLTYGGDDGLRMPSRSAPPSGGAPVPVEFERSEVQEESNRYWSKLPGPDDLDRFYWGLIRPTLPLTVTTPILKPVLEPGSEVSATLDVVYYGYSGSSVNPDHHVRVFVNNQFIGESWWDGAETVYSTTYTFTHDYLDDGENEISFHSPGDTGASSEVDLLDRYALGYVSQYVAEGDRLTFGVDAPGVWEFQIRDFGDSDLELFDVTDPYSVTHILDLVVEPAVSTYTLRFEDDSLASTRYFAETAAQRTILALDDVEKDIPSNWASPSNGADEIIIAPSIFVTDVQPLVDHRQDEGLRVAFVELQDVFDEFSYGRYDARAIQAFLKYAYENWAAPAPVSVLLVGDGHYDYKDNLGSGYVNPMPPYLAKVDPWIGETASDNRYVCLSGDDIIPEMNLGRLPANTVDDVRAMVAKILAFEGAGANQSWHRNVTLVADNPDDAGNFYYYADSLRDGYLPDIYQANRIYLEDTDDFPLPGGTCPDAATCKQQSKNSMNITGTLIVNYIGHAAQRNWAHEVMWHVDDIPTLYNAGQTPIFLAMTCWDGWFIAFGDYFQSIGERIVRADGKGAVANWAFSGLGVATGHDAMNKGFYKRIFSDDIQQIGPATLEGKLWLYATGQNYDLIETSVLFGDPELEIQTLKPDLRVQTSVDAPAGLAVGDVLTYTVAFTNAEQGIAHGVVLSNLLPIELVSPTVVYASPEVLTPQLGVTYSWAISDLPPHTGGEVWIRAVVGSAVEIPFKVVNYALITSLTPDIDSSNNVVSSTLEVNLWGRLYLPLVTRSYP